MCAPSRWAFRFSTASIPILISLHEVYDKICSYAENLVKTGEDISREYGIPIVNKRIAVTPIAMLAGANPGASPVRLQGTGPRRKDRRRQLHRRLFRARA